MTQSPPHTPPPAPHFPPLFHGRALTGATDPFAKARMIAILGCDAGLVTYNLAADQIRAAMVFAPETALIDAMPVLIACAIGFQNALGALAPPEVSVHLDWPGQIYVNGAKCGRLQIAASHSQPDDIPDWIVVGLELPLIPLVSDAPNAQHEPGAHPNQTCLFEEGCVDIAPQDLVSAWVRHSLVWINQMQDQGLKPLNAAWRGLARELGQEVCWPLGNSQHRGLFVGVDENFAALLRDGDTTRALPLTTLLQGNE